jgi:hypothetical protein
MLWLVAVFAMTVVGAFTGLALGKRASTWCPGCGQSSAGFAPRPFALLTLDDGDDRDRTLLAWGMTLPDGSAVVVDWRNGPSSGVTLSASPDQSARMHGADLVWLPKLPQAVRARSSHS